MKENKMNKITYRLMSFIALITMIFINHHAAMALAASNTRKIEQHPVLLFSNMYYVSTTGSDTNTGTNSAPFKTFAKAVSVLQAGDTLQVVAGTYNETLTLSTSGTSAAPITVIGNGAILNMQGLTQNGITISGSYINVSRFEVIGAIDFGIHVTGKNVKVENNILHDNVTKNGVGTCGISTSWGSAVKVKVGGENTIIRN